MEQQIVQKEGNEPSIADALLSASLQESFEQKRAEITSKLLPALSPEVMKAETAEEILQTCQEVYDTPSIKRRLEKMEQEIEKPEQNTEEEEEQES